MRTIGAFEAKTHFSDLLQKVEAGEEILITRRGKPIARLTSVKPGHDVEAARTAAENIRSLARSMDLGPFDWPEWKRYRDEGRR